MSIDPEVIPALKKLGTAVVSDAIDRLGIDGQASQIMRITGMDSAFPELSAPVATC